MLSCMLFCMLLYILEVIEGELHFLEVSLCKLQVLEVVLLMLEIEKEV